MAGQFDCFDVPGERSEDRLALESGNHLTDAICQIAMATILSSLENIR
jgi:hypothetical protein